MFLLSVIICTMAAANAQYWTEREKFIQDERNLALGAGIELTEKEQQVNAILMKYKRNEFEDGFRKPANYPGSMHFFKGKNIIEKSLVFSIIKQMPKGAVLHAHDMALLPAEWIVQNVTYRDDLYACKKNEKWNFCFKETDPGGDWQSVKQLRRDSCSNEVFDKWLVSLFTLEDPNPETKYGDLNAVWRAFMDIFMVITPLLTYKPVFKDYIYEVLQHLYNDNIQYMEMRGTLPDIYDLNGEITCGADSVEIMNQVNEKFRKNHPDHMGMKFIYAPPRHVENDTMQKYVDTYKTIKKNYPNFITGFDMVGQEDMGKPLCDFVNELKEFDKDTKFFFHAGETDWNGMSTDKNLVDAILLNTTRIGHGYAILKHPKVLEEVKKRGIAIEINPISNQVLMLVKDLRNHPGSFLLSQDYPVVISSDDPGFWGGDMLSYDFYMAFMGMASYDDDLKFLKQLIMNSLKYSALTIEENKKIMKLWQEKWVSFLNLILKEHNGKPDIYKNNV